MREFRKLDDSYRELVFYSEGSADWPHLGPVIETLLREHNRRVSYLTSDKTDPGLRIRDTRFRAFLIGSGTVRTILFRGIDCAHFIMTLPDLDSFHLRRSVNRVHYVYLFHSTNSTHTIYRKGALDAYDTLLCVGPHHIEEIRKTERVYHLKAKQLIEHGSVKLDSVLKQCGNQVPSQMRGEVREVLIAPSWGECSLIERTIGSELIDVLIRGGFRTVLRLHPMTTRRLPGLVRELKEKFGKEPLFAIEEDMNANESWLRSDVMISDWSGAALEYCFSLQKPVIFVDTPQKINNPEWQAIGVRAFEDMIRFEVGRVVEQSEIDTLPALIGECLRDSSQMRERILAARSKWIFNVGRSHEFAAEYLVSLGPSAEDQRARHAR